MRSRDYTYYEVLGVKEDSLQKEIDARYNQLVGFLAADSLADELKPWAEGQLALVKEAYAVLGDPARRRGYDIRRRGPAAAASTPRAPVQTPATPRRRPRAAAPKEVATPGTGRWKMGPLPMAVGGLFLGVVVLLLIVTGTGKWDNITGLFSRSSDGGAAQPGLVDEKRVAVLETAIQQDPANVEALFEMGEMYFDAKEWPNVIYWFGRLLEVDPNHVHALNDVALANFYLGRYPQAQAAWDRALELEPKNPLLHYALAFFLLNSPPYDLAQARTHFQTVVELASDSDPDLAKSARSDIESIDATLASATPEAEG